MKKPNVILIVLMLVINTSCAFIDKDTQLKIMTAKIRRLSLEAEKAREWLSQHDEVYKNGVCVTPSSQPPAPKLICNNLIKSEKIAEAACFIKHYGCDLYIKSKEEKFSSESQKFFAEQKCTAIVMSAFGERYSIKDLATSATQKAMEHFFNGIAKASNQFQKSIEYRTCIAQKKEECFLAYRDWQQYPRKIKGECEMALLLYKGREKEIQETKKSLECLKNFVC